MANLKKIRCVVAQFNVVENTDYEKCLAREVPVKGVTFGEGAEFETMRLYRVTSGFFPSVEKYVIAESPIGAVLQAISFSNRELANYYRAEIVPFQIRGWGKDTF